MEGDGEAKEGGAVGGIVILQPLQCAQCVQPLQCGSLNLVTMITGVMGVNIALRVVLIVCYV